MESNKIQLEEVRLQVRRGKIRVRRSRKLFGTTFARKFDFSYQLVTTSLVTYFYV
jgi:hypothetical protein